MYVLFCTLVGQRGTFVNGLVNFGAYGREVTRTKVSVFMGLLGLQRDRVRQVAWGTRTGVLRNGVAGEKCSFVYVERFNGTLFHTFRDETGVWCVNTIYTRNTQATCSMVGRYVVRGDSFFHVDVTGHQGDSVVNNNWVRGSGVILGGGVATGRLVPERSVGGTWGHTKTILV